MDNEKIICIIICAGEATRWGNYLEVPKHLIPLEGEVMLERLVKQLSEKPENDIYVVAKNDDDRYKIPGSTLYIADLNPDNVDADKFLSSQNLWNKNGRTIVFYGDVWFSNNAIKKILNHKGKDWILFGRHHASKITGCPWGELFAQSFYPKDIPEHKANLHKIARAYKNKKIRRCGGWEHYRAMSGIPLKQHKIKDRFYNIDDWTDDFDKPKDYERWIKNRANWHKKQLPMHILHLESDEDRKTHIDSYLMKRFPKMKIFPAVDGSDTAKVSAILNQAGITLDWNKWVGRKLSAGERGIWCSYINYLQWMVENNIREALIIQDDVTPCKGFIQKVNKIRKTLSNSGGWYVQRLGPGDTGLLISLRGAKYILNKIKRRKNIMMPTDLWMKHNGIINRTKKIDGIKSIPYSYKLIPNKFTMESSRLKVTNKAKNI